MPDLAETLSDILCGSDDTTAILHTCRFEGAGVEAYGRVAILALLRRLPVKVSEREFIASERFAGLFGMSDAGPVALIADLYGTHIARLWLLGSQALNAAPVARTDVAFDPDLTQALGQIAFDEKDHPDLKSGHTSWLREIAQRFSAPSFEALGSLGLSSFPQGARPFVLRAFSEGPNAAALLALVARRGDGSAGYIRFAAAAYRRSDEEGEDTIVVDEAGRIAEMNQQWHPYL